jgi:hypothetical protein
MHLPLTDVPADRVIRLEGPTVEQFAVAVDPLPHGVPVVVTVELPSEVRADPAAVVDELLDAVEAVARAQLRAWLPAADGLTGSSDLERRTVRRLARETASTSAVFGPFLADLAEAALIGGAVAARYDPQARSRALAGLLGDCYQRGAVVLALWATEPLSGQRRHAVGTAAQWLAHHGRIGTWIVGGGAVDPERFPAVTLPVPAELQEPTRADPRDRVNFPVLTGRPHPGSSVELHVEAALRRCGWAWGRAWNHVYQAHPLTSPIRVDLMWPTERLVVELDGPDHRGALKYADDRRRDNSLTLGGYTVLRFTNHEVHSDLSRVLAMIEELLTTRREDTG